ncbi:type II secretion system F family protein [Asanoa sp. WMMD1127]|uniref:type II secretion system F family protein n=1 Tax=Asanoa sp. WMMD1127 TaxID=3016107 RepID=UPI0024161C20|nr:type II secretion system F family protein [Asanoa sp. WMMD1127]MDG4823927.1 type II secretion system F family protein [Asanoa sp. WMMD1127]
MTRRLVAVVTGALAAVLLAASPAHADSTLAVSVADVRPGQVRLVAALPGGVNGRIPPVTVSVDGHALPAAVQSGAVPGAPVPVRSLTVVVEPGLDSSTDALVALAGAVPADVALGLVVAADPPVVAVRPTRDRAAFRTGVSDLPAGADADLGAALRVAGTLGPAGGERRLLLLAAPPSDGGSGNAPPPTGHRVDVVTVGPLGDLRQLAVTSGGSSRAATADTLASAVRATAALPALSTISVAVPVELGGAAATVRVSAGSGANRATADVDVRFAEPPADPAAAGGGPGSFLAGMGPGTLGGLIFGALLVAILLVVFGAGGTTRQRRLDQVQRFRTAGRGGPGGAPVPPGAGIAGTVSNLARAAGDDQRVAKRLDDAGIALRPGQWRKIQIVAVVVGAAVLGLLLGLLGILLGALLGLLLSMAYPRLLERRRKQAFADQLPDALALIVGSLRSGFSLSQALDGVVRDAPPGPLAVELGRAMSEVRLGADLADALERAAVRADSQDLAWAVIAIRIQHETGGNLAETLETTVDTIRERARLHRHVRALSAEGRLSAYLLIALPIVIAGWMLLVSHDYVSVLWTTTVGLVMLVGAVVLMTLGAFWLSRWLKVEV